jgi:hypothetical protein
VVSLEVAVFGARRKGVGVVVVGMVVRGFVFSQLVWILVVVGLAWEVGKGLRDGPSAGVM